MADTELKLLIKKRETLKGTVNRFKKYLETVDKANLIAVNELQVRLSHLETILQDFNSVQDDIELHDPSEYSNFNEMERESFENAYYKAMAIARDIINTLNVKSEHSDNDSVKSNHSINNRINYDVNSYKLPTMSLPTFSGEYDEWLNFHDTFKSVIHDNLSVSNVQKFHYLKSTLKGEAASVIQSIEASEENYIIAWELLKETFEDTPRIIQKHVKALFDLEPAVKDSHISLKQLLNDSRKHIRSLKTLNEPVDQWGTLLVYLISTKLDYSTKRDWEKYKSEQNPSPTLDELESFLKQRCNFLDNLKPNPNKRLQTNKSNIKSFVSTEVIVCKFCNENHIIHQCKRFLELPISERIKEMTKRKLCKNCLRKNHFTKDCRSSLCRKCNQRHNTLLHLDVSNDNKTTDDNPSHNSKHSNDVTNKPSEIINSDTPSVSLNCSIPKQTSVLLPTAVVLVYDSKGNTHKCRLLLDSASQSNFISQTLFKKLGIKGDSVNFPISGIGNSSGYVVQRTTIKLHSLYNNFNCTISCLILPEITHYLPESTFDIRKFNIPTNLQLADPTFNEPNEIQLLLGAEMFWETLCVGQFSLGKNSPIAQKTHFGWVISGPISLPQAHAKRHTLTCCFSTVNTDKSIQEQLASFWKLEEVNHTIEKTSEDVTCESFFCNTTTRSDNGKYIVRLPFKPNAFTLGESFSTAYRRLAYLEKRFENNPTLKQMYAQFMYDYETLGHMTQYNYTNSEKDIAYFLPHHAVFKPDSTSTKLRVVFDGSCKTSSGVSLNDTLMVGPTVQPDLFSILLRFRTHKYAFTADCEKMYRQVIIHENDRIYQNILWRIDPTEPVKLYQLNTVTYGTASAPFLATRCLLQIALDNESKYPEACSIIKSSFYVDDLIASVNSRETAITIISQINNILALAGFPLRKWTSNDPSILNDLSCTSDQFQFSDNNPIKTLGLVWNPEADQFMYPVNIQNDALITKRSILSIISKIFDPLGLIGPVIIVAKILIQKLWKLNSDWDESVPIDIHTSWSSFVKELQCLKNITIPRHVLSVQPSNVQLHGFADASEASYGTCLYLRSINNDDSVTVHLLCAKSRVAPLKVISLPRLELCAAHLLSKLASQVIPYLNIKIDEIHYWSDSTIVLAWINKPACQLRTFVANRVSEICSLTEGSEWHHVRSQDNPADIISRGTTPSKLVESKLWWHGPKWLAQNQSLWPINYVNFNLVDLPEIKRVLTVTLCYDFIHNLINRYSDLTDLQRVIAYCIRFIRNCRNSRDTRVSGPLSVSELQTSIELIIKSVQVHEFRDDIKRLQNKSPLCSSSKLIAFNPFLDDKGLIRIGGRLRHSNLNYNTKFPIMLPAKHPFTILIIRHFHLKYFHAGPQALISAIRQTYWPLSATTVVKKFVKMCVTCKRMNSKRIEPLMGDLPKSRTLPSRPFFTCGTDFAGPFIIRESFGRGKKTSKAYLCVFVCFVTKAVHLELVSNLSTEAFIACLKRFIARRGICSTIYSDNGTNYVGASNELKNWYALGSSTEHNNKITNFLSKQAISWKFIPARSPHFGGLWEAAVKSVKTHLFKIIGNNSLTFEQLLTLFAEIEAILNSRPLIPLSSNPDDLNFLSPAHFLIGDSLLAIPQPNLTEVKFNRLGHFQQIEQMKQQFWKKWSTDYLILLQRRVKWQQDKGHPLQPGALVLLKESSPPLLWRMGRVVEIHHGADGIVRVASVKTSSSIVKRAVTQLCELFTENDN